MRHLTPLAVKQASAPSSPASGDNLIYPKSDGRWYEKDSAGVERAIVTVDDTQTMTNKTLTSPKIGGGILDVNGVTLIGTQAVASAVNNMKFLNAGAGIAPQMIAEGTDTNISVNLVPKGTGVLKANGVEVVDLSTAQTMTNKTLTAPKIDQLNDTTNGLKAVTVEGVASAVNYVRLIAAATGSPASASVGAGGTDTDINLNLFSKGAGSVLANGVRVVDMTSAQTLTNKTLTDPVITSAMIGNSQVTTGTFTTSSTTELTLATVTVTCDGTTSLEVEFTWYNFVKSIAGDTFLWKLYDGATQLQQALNENTAVVNTGNKPLRAIVTPTSGSHTFTAKIVRNTGTGTASASPAATSPFDLTVKPRH